MKTVTALRFNIFSQKLIISIQNCTAKGAVQQFLSEDKESLRSEM
jgi:hypothetical protein